MTIFRPYLPRLCFAVCFFSILVMLSGVAPAAASPQGADVVPGMTVDEIDSLVLRTMEAFEVPGISVGIVKDGQLIYGRGHGVRQLGSPAPVDSDTLFAIASNTKAFTTAALAILVDEKVLTWDDKVIDHLPQFRLSDPYVTSEFTIRDLLTHRSGLGPYSGDLMFFPTTDFSREEIIDRLRYLPMTTGFRSAYAYDNNLYMVAGEVLAAASGSSWEDFVETRILGALGLEGCAVTRSRVSVEDNLASPHAVVEGTLVGVEAFDMEAGAAAGAIWCNISGMATWVGVQLNEGKFGGEEGEQVLFSEKQHREMWSPQTILRVSPASTERDGVHFRAYGLGWGLQDYDGFKRVGHTGGLPGMVTMVAMLPELELGVIVLTNQQMGVAFAAITQQIFKAYTQPGDREGQDWVEQFAEKLAERRAKAEASVQEAQSKSLAVLGPLSLGLSAYAGTYTDPWRGDVWITEVEGKLRMVFSRTEGLKGSMEHHNRDVFIVRWDDRSINADAYVRFTLGFEGEIEGMTMKAVSPSTDPSYDFRDLRFIPN